MVRRCRLVAVVLGVAAVVVACGAPAEDASPPVGAPSAAKDAPASVSSSPSAAAMACDGTRITVGAKEYCVMMTRRPFASAKSDCERMHGRLAVFGSAGSDRAFYEKIASPWGYGSGLWLGCSDTDEEGSWICGGKPMSFASWAPGQPDSSDALEDCAEWLADTGKWNDAPCSWTLGFVCRGDAALPCRDGRKLTAGATTFCAHPEPTDWDGAKKACAVGGGTLAAPISAQENAALFDSLKLPSAIPSWQPQQGVWIGLTDHAEEGKFKWVDGSPLATGNWSAGQPDDRGDQDCVTLTLTDGKWADETCGTALPYVCEPK